MGNATTATLNYFKEFLGANTSVIQDHLMSGMMKFKNISTNIDSRKNSGQIICIVTPFILGPSAIIQQTMFGVFASQGLVQVV